MRYNAPFENLTQGRPLARASAANLPQLFREAVNDGWVRAATGAWLLKRFLVTYGGSLSSFPDLTSCEATVNGRGVPDLDLSSAGIDRAWELAVRGYAFAMAALWQLNQMPDHPTASAYITLSSLEVDGAMLCTGYVTIVTDHENEPSYLGESLDAFSDPILIVESADCVELIQDSR